MMICIIDFEIENIRNIYWHRISKAVESISTECNWRSVCYSGLSLIQFNPHLHDSLVCWKFIRNLLFFIFPRLLALSRVPSVHLILLSFAVLPLDSLAPILLRDLSNHHTSTRTPWMSRNLSCEFDERFLVVVRCKCDHRHDRWLYRTGTTFLISAIEFDVLAGVIGYLWSLTRISTWRSRHLSAMPGEKWRNVTTNIPLLKPLERRIER